MHHRNRFAPAVSERGRRRRSDDGQSQSKRRQIGKYLYFRRILRRHEEGNAYVTRWLMFQMPRGMLSLVLLRCAPVSPGQESRREEEILLRECAVIIGHRTFDCSSSQIGFHFGSNNSLIMRPKTHILFGFETTDMPSNESRSHAFCEIHCFARSK